MRVCHPIDIYLRPGEFVTGGAGCTIRTLLGSCVAIVLWQPQRRVGAMAHFMLPARAGRGQYAPDARYGEEALWLMLRALAQREVAATECQAKIFGGANMFPHHHHGDAPHVGRKNGEAARMLLAAHRIAVVSESLFGAGHRQIRFDVGSGDVWSRQLALVEAAQGHG